MTSPPARAETRLRRCLLTILVLASGVIVVPGGQAGAQSGDELAAIRQRLARANAQTERVLNDLRSLDNEIYRVTRSLEAEEREVARTESEIRDAEAHIEQLRAQIAEVRESANARAARMYKSGPGSILAPLFTAASFADLPKLGMFWESLAERDGRTLSEAARLREDRDRETEELAAAVKALEAKVDELDEHRAGLEVSRRRRASSLQELRAAIQEAMDAEQKVLAARAAAIKTPESTGSSGGCRGGIPARDQRLARLLAFYAPHSGSAGLIPDKLSASGVVTTGDASWYGPGFDGCRSASGATFHEAQMTAASLSLPMGTILKVSKGGRAAVVVITDRGPYAHGRVLDLSRAAAEAIGLGAGSVDMEIMLPTEPAPPFP